jgi:hypothetical protein
VSVELDEDLFRRRFRSVPMTILARAMRDLTGQSFSRFTKAQIGRMWAERDLLGSLAQLRALTLPVIEAQIKAVEAVQKKGDLATIVRARCPHGHPFAALATGQQSCEPCDKLMRAPTQELRDMFPLVLYFGSEFDRNAFAEMARAHMPNCIDRKL